MNVAALEPQAAQPQAERASRPAGRPCRRRVCFPCIAQIHQTPHSLPIAVQLALRHPDIEVHVAATSEKHLEFIRRYTSRFPAAEIIHELLHVPRIVREGIRLTGCTLGIRLAELAWNRRYFDSFNALVVPERTSLLLRDIGVSRPKLVWTHHGAGDRASGFRRGIARFDFVVLAGHKLEQRLLELGLIRPGCYVTGVYPKFDWVRAMPPPPPLFDNGRPTVVYIPHFSHKLSSWPVVGHRVLDWFAARDDYNLVFAPHLRLFDPPTARKYRAFEAYQGLPHVRIDLGSEASIDMSYTSGADIYLGDVSSQVTEFLMIRPRPCVFLNPHGFDWQYDPSFRFWRMGEVISGPEDLEDGLRRACARQDERSVLQQAYVEDTFGADGKPTAHIAADALAAFLEQQASREGSAGS